jgi:hypothetical protein
MIISKVLSTSNEPSIKALENKPHITPSKTNGNVGTKKTNTTTFKATGFLSFLPHFKTLLTVHILPPK